MSKKVYVDDQFNCELGKLKNLNQELYKRFIKPLYLPLLTLMCCFLITFSKEQNDYSFKTIKVFLYVFFILVLSETLMRYAEVSKLYLLFLGLIPILFFFTIFVFLVNKVKYD